MDIRRGTTPEITYEASHNADSFDILWLSLKQGDIEITKEKLDVTINGKEITFKLTQDETLSFKAGSVSMQLRGRIGEEAVADEIKSFGVKDIIRNGKIGD